MHAVILFLVVISAGVGVIAYPTFQSNDDGTVSAFVDADDYDNLEDALGSFPYQKRFWSPHPSDYNPLRRRPVPVPRGSKRDEGVVYHPIPRVVTMNHIKQLRSGGHTDDESPEAVELFEGSRQKKQTRPTTLIFRLGSWGLRGGGKKQDKGQSPNPA